MSLRVLFMGTPEFAVPTLRALVAAGYDVVGVVTQPDRKTGRKQVLTPPPIKVEATAQGLRVLQPERVRRPEALAEIEALAPDIAITCAYGQILPQRLLDIPQYGCLNVHASLLPRWRGAAPMHRAILAGDTETGVTLMEMVLALDAGPMLGQVRVPIDPNDTVGTLHDKLADAGASLLADLLPRYVQGQIVPIPQPDQGVTYAERLTRSDEYIDWTRPWQHVYNQIRGLSPWPGATSFDDGTPVKIWTATPQAVDTHLGQESADPGTVLVHEQGVYVKCKDAWLRLVELQPSGKRKMAAVDWARGFQGKPMKLSGVVVEP